MNKTLRFLIIIYVFSFSFNFLATYKLTTVLAEIKLEEDKYPQDSKLKTALASAAIANRKKLQDMLHMTIVFVRIKSELTDTFAAKLKEKMDELFKPNDHSYDQTLNFTGLKTMGPKLAATFENKPVFNNMRQNIVEICKEIGVSLFNTTQLIEARDPQKGFLRYLYIKDESGEPLFVIERPDEFMPHISICDFKQTRTRERSGSPRKGFTWETKFIPEIEQPKIAIPPFNVMPRTMGKNTEARYFDISKTASISSEELVAMLAQFQSTPISISQKTQ